MPRTKAIESGYRRGKQTESVSSKKSQGSTVGSNSQEDEQKAEWSCRYDAKQGSYFFVDAATGEMTTTCPPEFEDEFHNMPQVQALKGVPRGFHKAALVIQSILKFKRARKPQFEKHLDTATGRYFFKNTFTHETTWDTPTGFYPLTRPPHATLEGLSLEKGMKQERKKKQSKQRRLLIQLRREEYHRGLKDKEAKGAGAAQRAALEAWNEAFRIACLTGELKMAWQKLGDVHEDLPKFQERFGKPLHTLRLMGHELSGLPPDFGNGGLRSLTSLNLASNGLAQLPDSFCQLRQLRQLNLLRNKLTILPAKFGHLSQLEVLHLSSNRLEELPHSFGALKKLGRVEMNANKLRGFPNSIGQLLCHTLAASSNKISSLTPAVTSMVNLQWLALNDNLLEGLPKEIGNCSKLERLHLMSNRLVELPETLGKLTRIRELWLGQNTQISALPESFYQLTNLRNLNMELCSSMVFPPLQYIEQGAPAVLKYSEGRISHSRHLRRQRMVDRLGNLFEQLHEQQPYFGRNAKAFFEAKHWHNDEEWFALALPINNFVAFKVSLRKFAKLLALDAQRKVGKSKQAQAAEAERAAEAAASPGGIHHEVLATALNKVFGWIPTLEPGGEVGLGVKATFQHERDEDEGKEDEAVAARLGGGHASGDSAHGDAAKEASAKMARLREAQARAAREQAALDACGAPEYTLTVLEATPGGAAAKAGLIGGQRISAVNEVNGKLVKNWREVVETIVSALTIDVNTDAPYAEGVKPPKDIEVRAELSGGDAALFWDKLLPLLEDYWDAGRQARAQAEENEDEEPLFLVPKKYAQSFPYERDELERVLSTFRDPWGPACVKVDAAQFRRCACVDAFGHRRVCVPPAAGFMCTRPALLLKMEIKLQRQKDAHDAMLREQAAMAAVEDIARKTAEAWTKTEEGVKYLKQLAEKTAESVVRANRASRARGEMTDAVAKKVEALNHKFYAEKKKLELKLERQGTGLKAKLQELEAAVETSSGLARDLKEQEVDKVTDQLEALPEVKALEALKERHEDQIAALTEPPSDDEDDGGGGDRRAVSHTSSEYKKVKSELIVDVARQYVEREVKKARDAKEREISNLQKIQKAWGGVGLKDCFYGWRKYARLNVNDRYRENAKLKRAKFNAKQVPKATIKLARWKVLMWGQPKVDVWSDELYWVHRRSGAVRWTKPTTQEYVPANFVMPAQYRGMTDAELDAIHVRDDVPFEEVEVPYQSEELGNSSSEDDSSSEESDSDDSDDSDDDSSEGESESEDEDKDESESEDEDEGERGGESRATTAMTTATSASGDSNDDGSATNRTDDDGENAMIEGPDGTLVPRPTTSGDGSSASVKPPMPVSEAMERSLDEAKDALVKMRARRAAAVAAARERHENALAEKERAQLRAMEDAQRKLDGRQSLAEEEAEAAKAALKAQGNQPVAGPDDVGFDASKTDYTEAELTAMALELYKKNAAEGLDEEGNKLPSLLR